MTLPNSCICANARAMLVATRTTKRKSACRKCLPAALRAVELVDVLARVHLLHEEAANGAALVEQHVERPRGHAQQRSGGRGGSCRAASRPSWRSGAFDRSWRRAWRRSRFRRPLPSPPLPSSRPERTAVCWRRGEDARSGGRGRGASRVTSVASSSVRARTAGEASMFDSALRERRRLAGRLRPHAVARSTERKKGSCAVRLAKCIASGSRPSDISATSSTSSGSDATSA